MPVVKMATLDSACEFNVLQFPRSVSVFKGKCEARQVIILVDIYLRIWYQLFLENV